jgi:hypothetical protein
MHLKTFIRLSVILALLTGAAVLPASATILDLTTLGSSGYIGSAFFRQTNNEPTGTGVFDPFVRIQANGSEQGVNSNGPYTMDEKVGIWTHSMMVGDCGTLDLNGTNYTPFLLDINQTAASPLLSLDQLRLYTSTTGTYNTLSQLDTNANLVYNLDAGTDNTVYLNYLLDNGSGQGDMVAYIPTALLSPYNGQYLYFYSQFGATGGAYASNDGFEEWACITGSQPPPPPVPEPTSLLLLGGGLLGLVGARRLRRK